MLKFVILTLVFTVSVQAFAKGKCPWAHGKYPFDEDKFEGDWYVVAANPKKGFDEPSACGKVNIKYQKSENETMILGRKSFKENDTALTAEIHAQPIKKDYSSISLAAAKRNLEGAKWDGVYKQVVIASDYTSYALSLSCKSTFDPEGKTFSRRMFAEIWGREPSLPEITVNILKSIISGYDVEPSSIKLVDHSNC